MAVLIKRKLIFEHVVCNAGYSIWGKDLLNQMLNDVNDFNIDS